MVRFKKDFLCLITVLLTGVCSLFAEEAKQEDVKLTAGGEKLFLKYSEMLKSLQSEVVKSVPKIGNAQKVDARHLWMVGDILSSDKLDAKLVKCAVLYNGTPRGLAVFAQRGEKEEKLVEKLLGDDELMKQMLVAGGAKGGKYGRAMQIYTDIQKASKRAGKGVFQRLALGTSLEHAAGVQGFDVKTNIDPVKRYLSYEKAYLEGDLDPNFGGFGAWEFRYVTNSNAPDEQLEWGRQMLRNYRPDHILLRGRLLYSMVVKTDVVYKTPVWETRPKTYQQLICGGGMCGPIAWFGRFILRSHGIPVWGVQQKGHAALARWTPSGWMTNFGMRWEYNWWEGLNGTNFYLDSQARATGKNYMKVLRAEWIADALGQEKADGMVSGSGGTWNVVAYLQRKAIVSSGGVRQLSNRGESGEEIKVNKLEKFRKEQISAADKKIATGADGTIIIPAAACSKPRFSGRGTIFMKSFPGGMQMHHARTMEEKGKNKTADYDPVFEYSFNVAKAGKYALTGRVVTVNKGQQLLVTPNYNASPIKIDVPYTVGMWGQTEPVLIKLVKGNNKLHFTRSRPYYGLSIKEFILTPVSGK